jgi:two-component SAPR family response regulator
MASLVHHGELSPSAEGSHNGVGTVVPEQAVATATVRATTEDHQNSGPGTASRERPRSDLLRKLDGAPLRARCFGARGVWHGERRIWPSPDAVQETGWELLLLLAVHRVTGVQAETLADMLWEEDGAVDPGSTLRKRRRRLRLELQALVPDLAGEPMPTDPKGRVYTLDPSVIASDVHQFLELAAWAKTLPRSNAIATYEEALALYGGDLLDSLDVPTYAWLYDGAAIATTLRPDYRRIQEDLRRHLADLCAEGSQDAELLRAQELYTELTGERPDDDHLWVALLRVQGRRGDVLGVQTSVRRLRTALVELGHGADPDKAALPPNVLRVLQEMQAQTKVVA